MAKDKKASKTAEEGYADEPKTQGVSTFEEGDDALTINLDAVEEAKFENVPAGIYDAVIDKATYKLSKASQQPMWDLQLTISDGEFSGRKLFAMVSFSEKALPMAKATISRIAPELISSAFNPKKIADEGELLGVTVRAKVIIEAYNGEDRSRVKDLLAPSAGSGEFA